MDTDHFNGAGRILNIFNNQWSLSVWFILETEAVFGTKNG